jgi:hypothetical protein
MDAPQGRILTARGDRMKLIYDGVAEPSNERSRFLIARRDARDEDVMVFRLPDGQMALPAFGREEAGTSLPPRASARK